MIKFILAILLGLFVSSPLLAAPSSVPEKDLLQQLLLDIAPPPPNQTFEIPQPVLLTEPRSLLSNAVIVAPGTVKIQIGIKNKEKIAPIKSYVFQIVDLGMPLVDFDDKFLHQSNSPHQNSLRYTFTKGGRYAIIASVITIHGDVGSTRLNVYAR